MNFSLDAAAKTAEVIGALAVVIGLLFVGLEIRGNTVPNNSLLRNHW